MNNLPTETLRNIVCYAGESAKFINSRFYEIALSCTFNVKPKDFLLIDLSTITMKELVNLKGKGIKYIKCIVTKHRPRNSYPKILNYLFDYFSFLGIHLKVPVCFECKTEERRIQKYLLDDYLDRLDFCSLLYIVLDSIFNNQRNVKNLIIDLNEYSEAFCNLRRVRYLKKYFNLIDNYMRNFANSYISNFIYVRCNFDKGTNFMLFNGIHNYIDYCNFFNIGLNFHRACDYTTKGRNNVKDYNSDGPTMFNEYNNKTIEFRDGLFETFDTNNLHRILKLK